MKKHINSYNLHHGDIVKCIKSIYKPNSEIYFEEGVRYIIREVGLNQTDSHEIFMREVDSHIGYIHYILDVNFDEFFIVDIKEIRKRKMNKITNG